MNWKSNDNHEFLFQKKFDHPLEFGNPSIFPLLANMHCRGRGTLRLIQCVPRTVRNGAHLRRSSLDKVSRDNPPCLLERAASVRMSAYARGRVRVCVCVCACVGLHEPHHSTTEVDIKRQRTYEPENEITKPPDVPITKSPDVPKRVGIFLNKPWNWNRSNV